MYKFSQNHETKRLHLWVFSNVWIQDQVLFWVSKLNYSKFSDNEFKIIERNYLEL